MGGRRDLLRVLVALLAVQADLLHPQVVRRGDWVVPSGRDREALVVL